MLIDTQKVSGTISSQAFSANTNPIRGIVKQIIVEPASEANVYNISIVNEFGSIGHERTSETGCYAELTDLPVRGAYTINITEATVDEDIAIYLITKE